MDQELDDRKKKILKAIIKTYIIVWFDAKIKSRSGIMSLLRDISYSPTPQPEEFLLIKVIAST